MTILNFLLSEDAVCVMTDTLVTTTDGAPAFFTTKIQPVPHWNGLICGTGSLEFILAWTRRALGGVLAVDLVHADEFVPDILRDLQASAPATFEGGQTSTIYHFGYDEAERRFVGFAYRSTNGFESDRLRYGLGIKPPTNIVDRENWGWPDDFVSICEQQKAEDEALPLPERVGVGGHVVSYMLDVERGASGDDFVRTIITRPHAFADADTAYWAALQAMWAGQDAAEG